MTTFLALIIVFLINIPFGYLRYGYRKFSVAWFLAIHIPVALSIGLRYLLEIKFSWTILPLFVIAFFLGQLSGKFIPRICTSATKNQDE